MTGPATYGQLMDRAAWATARGVAQVENLPFPDAGQAYATIADYHELLRALEAHTWAVLDPRRVETITAEVETDPREWAATRLIAELRPVIAHQRGLPEPGTSTSPWIEARRFVRAATDLLGTHRDPSGEFPRSPDVEAVLNDPAARQAALARIGDITASVLGARTDLLLRTAQVQGNTRRARYVLPEHPAAEERAREVAGLGPAPQHPRLEDLTVADPGVRTGSVGQEVADRMIRLRHAAWALGRAEHPSVETVKSLATLSLVLHAHALAHRGHPPGTVTGVPAADRESGHLVERAQAWAKVGREIFTWRTPAPADPRVVADVRAVTALLRRHAPLTGPQPDLDRVHGAQLRQLLAGAVAITSDVATYTSQALGTMAATGQLHVPGASLTGEQVTDRADLVQAKLTGRLAPAPPEDVHRVRGALDRLVERPDPRLLGAGGLTLRAAPLTTTPPATGMEPVHRSPS